LNGKANLWSMLTDMRESSQGLGKQNVFQTENQGEGPISVIVCPVCLFQLAHCQ